MSNFRRILMGQGYMPYQQVEYLQSDSSAYIDTLIGGSNNDLEIECVCSYDKHVLYGSIFANYIDEEHNVTRFILFTSPYAISNLNVKADKSTMISFHINNKHKIYMDKDKIIVDGSTYSWNPRVEAVDNNTNIILFNRSNTIPVFRDIGLKIYSFKISKNGEVLRDFVPVRVGDVGYMYDRVSKQLFENVGTGQFILGPDV